MTRQDIYAILVIYNDSLADSLTFQGIGDAGVNLLICDNSTSDYGNAAFCEGREGITYLNMGGNVGLPKAYNAAIARVPAGDHLICLFDDDTEVPSDYFDALLRAAEEDEAADVFLPLVYDEVGLLSPDIVKGLDVRRASLPDELSDEITAINSAMAVRTRVFADFRYDEGQFLDYVDHAFMREMRRRGTRFHILRDTCLHQTFSVNVDSEESAAKRFKILKKDVRYYYRETPLYYAYMITRWRVRLCLKYKTPHFLFV